MYVDVHTHLTHQDFAHDVDAVVARAQVAGLGAMIVNGLEPVSNRRILAMAAQHSIIKPALGIYPLDAINHLNPSLPFPMAHFDVNAELDFIRQAASKGSIVALGECGLDGYWVTGDEELAAQETVFEAFIAMSLATDTPLIIHTRKREERAMAMLAHHGSVKVNFHCYGGRVPRAIEGAEKHGWYFSIPANARKNEAFTKMLSRLPPERILTETDAPYLSPEKGTRNEPAQVVGTIAYLAERRGWSVEQAKATVWENFTRLFPRAVTSSKGTEAP